MDSKRDHLTKQPRSVSEQCAAFKTRRISRLTSSPVAPIVDYHSSADPKPSCGIYRKVPNNTFSSMTIVKRTGTPSENPPNPNTYHPRKPVKISVASGRSSEGRYTYTARSAGYCRCNIRTSEVTGQARLTYVAVCHWYSSRNTTPVIFIFPIGRPRPER